MSDGLRLAAALAALLCAAGASGSRSRSRASRAGAARSREPRCSCSRAPSRGAAVAAAGALLLARTGARSRSCMVGAIAAGIAAAFAVPVAGRARSAGARAAWRPGARSTVPAAWRAAGATAASRDEVLSLIVDEARALLSARAVLVLPVEGGDRAGVEAALAEHGAEGMPSIVVPVRARRRHVARGDRPRGLERGRARAAGRPRRRRPQCARRRHRARRRRLGAAARRRRRRRRAQARGAPRQRRRGRGAGGGAAQPPPDRERRRAPGRGAGALVPGAGRPRGRPPARRGGARLRRLRARHRRLRAHAPAHARRGAARRSRRSMPARSRSAWPVCAARGRQLAAAQAALVRAAESLAAELHPDRVLQRLAEVVPGALHADAAAIWLDEPEQERLRVTHVHGHPDHAARRDRQLPHRRGRRGHQRRAPGRRAARGRRPRGPPRAGRRAPRAGRAAAPRRPRARRARRLVVRRRTPASRPPTSSSRQALARLASLAVETAQAYDERGAQARIDRASSELTAELAMARNSDGLRESLRPRRAPDARRRRGARAPRRRARGRPREHGRGTDRARAAGRCASAASSPPAALGSDSRVSAEERAARAGRRAAGRADRARRRARRRRRRHARCGAARASSTTPTSRSPSGCAWPPPPRVERVQLEEAERRASTTARELQRVGALLAADLDPRAVLRADRGAGRQPAGRRRLRPAPARGGRARRCARPRARRSRASAASACPSATCSRPRCSRPRRPVALDDLAGRRPARAATIPCVRPGFASWAGAPIASADGGVQGMLAIFGRQPAAPARRRGRGRWPRSPTRPRSRCATRSSTRRVADEKDRVAAILGRVADAHRRRRRRRPRHCSGTPPPRQITQIPERRALGRALAELLRSELGDADGSAHGAARRRGRDRRPRCGSRARAQELWLSVTAARHERAATAGPAACSRCATSPRCARSSSSRATSWPPSRTSCARR